MERAPAVIGHQEKIKEVTAEVHQIAPVCLEE